MPDYNIRVFQLNYFVKLHVPDLYYYFKHHDLNFDLIYQKWIMTLFANYLPINKLLIVWHFFLIDKWEAIVKYSLILIKLSKQKLLTVDLESLCKFIKETDWLDNIPDIQFFNHYKEINSDLKFENIISNEALSDLKDQFYMELITNKLGNSINKDKWQEDQINAIDEYYKKYNKISTIVKDQIQLFKKKIESITKKYHLILIC